MSENLRAIAQSLVDAHEQMEALLPSLAGCPEPMLDGALRVARAYLSEHPADDCEAIDEEWLRSVGMAHFRGEPDSSGLEISNGCTQISRGYRGQWLVNGAELDDLSWPKTRGDLRRLAAALGVPLNEVPEGKVLLTVRELP